MLQCYLQNNSDKTWGHWGQLDHVGFSFVNGIKAFIRKVSYSFPVLIEIKSVVVHFHGKAFDSSHLPGYQPVGVWGGATDTGT
jgi:hypothetical protein